MYNEKKKVLCGGTYREVSFADIMSRAAERSKKSAHFWAERIEDETKNSRSCQEPYIVQGVEYPSVAHWQLEASFKNHDAYTNFDFSNSIVANMKKLFDKGFGTW